MTSPGFASCGKISHAGAPFVDTSAHHARGKLAPCGFAHPNTTTRRTKLKIRIRKLRDSHVGKVQLRSKARRAGNVWKPFVLFDYFTSRCHFVFIELVSHGLSMPTPPDFI